MTEGEDNPFQVVNHFLPLIMHPTIVVIKAVPY